MACALSGAYLQQHTFARRSMATPGVACFVDHTCRQQSCCQLSACRHVPCWSFREMLQGPALRVMMP